MPEPTEFDALITAQAGRWDVEGLLPVDVLRDMGRSGLLCAQLSADHGGLGLDSLANGRLTAHIGSMCSSVRSVMTSQGMAAWSIERLGTPDQRAAWLPKLAGGELAAVAFSEPPAGSDLSAIATTVEPAGDDVIVNGGKVWITAARYADLVA